MTKEELDKEFPEGVKAAIQRGKEIVMARGEKARMKEQKEWEMRIKKKTLPLTLFLTLKEITGD